MKPFFLPPSFGRRCPEGAEVGRVKRYSRIRGNQPRLASLVCPFQRKGREIFVIRGQGPTLSPYVSRTSPLSSSVFHAACALSAPAGHLPLEGKAAIREYHPLKRRRSATFIPHFSFEQSFHSGARDSTPYGLPPPLYLIPQNRSVFSFAHFVSTSSETPMYCASVLAT